MKQQLMLYSTGSTVLIKLGATNRTHLSTKQVVSEPKVEKSEISLGSHGGGGARERLRKVARVVWLESCTRGLAERLPGDHMSCM